jgi:uncharacterized RmlC-like cupin family protein
MNAESGVATGGRECVVIRTRGERAVPQGTVYGDGITAESAGAQHLSLNVVTVPPGAAGKPHQHDGHETAICQTGGVTATLWGERLEHLEILYPGDLLFIPPGVPHLPINVSDTEVCSAVIARTHAAAREPTTMRPDLDAIAATRIAEARRAFAESR